MPADTALSFVAPYIASVPAELVGASGVLSVVTAGLLLAHKAPILQSAPSRLAERINWSSVTFVLENAVFLLIGLQIASLLEGVGEGEQAVARVVVKAHPHAVAGRHREGAGQGHHERPGINLGHDPQWKPGSRAAPGRDDTGR